ncbi:MAG: Unknown protein [uncultured Aureispira sp.]|uniref:KTSC domain-containing protein n=1 Tax=uncultured Aureispira sp. TaxID=1331704 RepID=A0A6S6UH73_9BACT|nr:MAG: Unknown protein [uncultured Aureispira sp.]
MKRLPVRSSNLSSIGYDEGVLEIEFKTRKIYQYHNVPNIVYEQLMSAQSHGKYFASNIKKSYSYSKLR